MEPKALGLRSRRFMKASMYCHVIAVTTLLALSAHAAPKRQQQEVNGWKSWVNAESLDRPGQPVTAAPFFHLKVFRQGPTEKQPQLLFEKPRHGGLSLSMNDAGVVLIFDGGEPSTLFFPGHAEPVPLMLAPNKRLATSKNWPWGLMSNMSPLSFLGDTIFYGKLSDGNGFTLGTVTIDAEKAAIVQQRIIVDEQGRGVKPHEVQIAYQPRPIRIGSRIIWKNEGSANTDESSAWSESRARVADLTTGAVEFLTATPEKWWAGHEAELAPFLSRTR